MRVLPAFVAVAIVASTTGCGPIVSTYLIIDAEAKFAGAQAAEADRFAIYEYTASEAYLKKAHEELGYADYGPAIDYAYKAADLAAQGTERANEARHKRIDDADAAATTATTESTESPTSSPTPPKKVIIKKLDVPSVPANDPSPKPGPK
jgi:hypothetical protein